MADKYIAMRPLDVGSKEIDEDRSTDDHKVAKVHHYEPGDEVEGAAEFGNLADLVEGGFLAKSTAESKKAAQEAATESAVDALGPDATEVERSAARAEAAGAKPPKEIEEAPAASSPATEKPPAAKAKTARKSTRKSTARKTTRSSPRT